MTAAWLKCLVKTGACTVLVLVPLSAPAPIEIEPSGCDTRWAHCPVILPLGPVPSDTPCCLIFEPNSYLLRYFGSGAGTLVPAPINKLAHTIITP